MLEQLAVPAAGEGGLAAWLIAIIVIIPTLIACALSFYCWRTKCMKQPFLSPPAKKGPNNFAKTSEVAMTDYSSNSALAHGEK